jgi:phosphoglycolate phosphatase
LTELVLGLGAMNVLFDLDGTLTDSREGIIACFKYAFQTLKLDSPADPELERMIGPPLRESFANLIGPNKEDLLEQAVTLYRERFAAKGMFGNSVYPGIGDALAQLRDYGSLLVATSKPRMFAERIIEHFGLSRFFRAVYGSEMNGANADKRDLIAHILRAASLSPTDTVMVGDRAHDVLGARANGLFPVGVLWGYGSREELVLAGAGAICEEPRMLIEMIALGKTDRVAEYLLTIQETPS